MRKRRCNPPWDHMNKSDYHPVLLSLNPLSFALLGPHPYRFSSCYPGDVSERCPISTYSSPFPSFFPDSFPLRYPFHSSLSRPFVQAGPPSLIRSLSTEPHVSESIRAESRRGRSFTEGEGCEDHCYSVLNATNALDVGPETRLPGRALSIASPSCQQQPNGLSICDF
ncbi:Small ribosomal subunit biogenesis GTPase RsgA [Dissostichus eleginoides]|uniref:Small ribosomal subunit biogenesis GTPase RsgA n=1 Tax=Dissostichus eleginoides TaxID=100907 RepID=A0AAD9C7Y4_DISEL|nr:Small ribosomal subunit biogenesis GTPase RsgA [Dissostichus eleginoides]